MKTYNSAPYYDDFDQAKSYYQILFNPGTAVQARELTQLQTILRNQIEKFGNHVFKQGSVVIPGNSFTDLAVPYVKIQATYGGQTLTNTALQSLEGRIIAGPEVTVSGVQVRIRALVRKVVVAEGSDPATLYLSYLSGAGSATTFTANQTLSLESTVAPYTYTASLTTAASSPTGVGSMAFVNNGVYYVNGTFAYVAKQSIVISKYTSTPSCSVLLKIEESIVTSADDETLLDPAQGSYNFAAPGGDRVKILLTLMSLPLGSSITNDYVELMRYDTGELLEHNRNPQYSELEKSLARRTYDESGNYVVSGLNPSVKEATNAAKLTVEVSPGKAYIEGFEVDKVGRTQIEIDKGRTSDHIKNTDVSLRPTYGQYVLVSDIVGAINIAGREQITLWNDNDHTNGSATQIGTAKVLAIDYYIGDVAAGTSIYKLWLTDVAITTQSIDSVGGIRFAAGQAWVVGEFNVQSQGTFVAGSTVSHVSGRTGTVRYWNASNAQLYVYKHDHTQALPRVGDLITQGSVSALVTARSMIQTEGDSSLVFELPKTVLHRMTTSAGAYDHEYIVQKQFSITTSSATNGTGTATLSDVNSAFFTNEVGTWVGLYAGGIAKGTLTVGGGGTQITYTKATAESSSTGPFTVYVQVRKTLSPRTKTLTLGYAHTASMSNASVFDLAHVDVINIQSISHAIEGDITSRYDLDPGQTDYQYNTSSIRLKPGATAPATGQNVTVTYDYYAHSASGDFFCIDSYGGNSGFRDRITPFTSPTTGKTYDLLRCVDFRISASTSSDVVVSDTEFSAPLQFYVPRIDTLTVNSSGTVSVIKGTPSESPKPPSIPDGLFALNLMYIPEYTRSAAAVTSKRLNVQRFRMQDIQGIVDRVERLEEFATLSAAETDILNYDVVDANTGLTRFKTGYLVENFAQPLAIARTTSGDFAATFIGKTLQAGQEKLVCSGGTPTLSNVVNKNGMLMLPYTEVVFAQQPLSSRVTNINPFAVISWNGVLAVNPPSDQWVDVIELPTIFETREEFIDLLIVPPTPQPPVSTAIPVRPPRTPEIVVRQDTDFSTVTGVTPTRSNETTAVNWWTSTLDTQSASNALAAAAIDQSNVGVTRSILDISLSAQVDTMFTQQVSAFPTSLSVVGPTSTLQSTTSLVFGGTQRIVAR